MRKGIVIVLLILIKIPFCFAQIGYNEKEYFLNGKEDFKSQKYRSALYYFEKINSKNKFNQDAKYYAAICKLHLNIYKESLRELKAIKTVHLKENIHYFYWLSEAYFLNEDFENAINTLKLYLKSNPKNKIETYDAFVLNIKVALELYQNAENYTVQNMGQHLNSPFDEFGVSKVPSLDNLIYSSNRLTFDEKNTDRYDTEILTLHNAKIEKNGTVKQIEEWNKSASLDSQFVILQILEYEFTSSDKTFLITQNGDLKTLKRERGIWQTPQLFSQKLNKEKGIQEYAYLSKDKKILVFASDYKSKGNYELFVSRRKNIETDFEEPILLEKVNSKSSEITPFLDKDNTLYFSSNRKKTAGGFDVFKAEFDTLSKNWKTPLLLPYPINSVADELYFSIHNSNNQISKTGYFASNRTNGQGGSDIYQVFFFDSVKIKGQFRERTIEKKPIQNATIIFKSINYTEDSISFQTKTDKDGNYKINVPINLKDKVSRDIQSIHQQKLKNETVLNMEVYYQGKLAYQNQVIVNAYELAQRNSRSYLVNAYLYVEDKIESAHQKIFQQLITNLDKKIILKNIYFERSNAILKKESYQKLDELGEFLIQNESLNLEIIGHTDNIGTAAQNLILSKKRAQSVIDYLVNKGVEKSRLKPNGYGQQEPIASNDDEKEGRELNRRIEIKVWK